MGYNFGTPGAAGMGRNIISATVLYDKLTVSNLPLLMAVSCRFPYQVVDNIINKKALKSLTEKA